MKAAAGFGLFYAFKVVESKGEANRLKMPKVQFKLSGVCRQDQRSFHNRRIMWLPRDIFFWYFYTKDSR